MKVRIKREELEQVLPRYIDSANDQPIAICLNLPETLDVEAEVIEECEYGHGPWAYHIIRPERMCMTCDVVEDWPSANSVEPQKKEKLLAPAMKREGGTHPDSYWSHWKITSELFESEEEAINFLSPGTGMKSEVKWPAIPINGFYSVEE